MPSSRAIPSVITWTLLAGTVVTSAMLPGTLTVPATVAQAAPDTFTLGGVIRDFRAAHVDFNVVPPDGTGHYAGAIVDVLDGTRRPALRPQGVMQNTPTADTDLVTYWSFDEGSGTTTSEPASGADGTLMNGPTWEAGRTGNALRFDGIDDYVNVSSNPALMISTDVTIAGWFMLDDPFDGSTSTSQIIIEKHLDDEHDTTIALIGTDYGRAEPARGSMVFKVENGPDVHHYRYKWTNRTSWNAGEWYHFAVVMNAGDSSQNRIIINGVDDTSATDAGTQGPIDWNYAVDFRIGGRDADYYQLSTPRYFKGLIDEIMIFSRSLTEGELVGTDGGQKVSSPWVDGNGRPMAPHLEGVAPDPNPHAILDTVLLVVENAASLSAQDAAKKTTIESFGYTVNVIDDDATPSEIADAVTINDVVYISEDVNHGDIDDRYKWVTIGVVNEDKDLSDDELGFSASKKTWTGTQIRITDNTHPITTGLPLGPLTITDAPWNLTRADGGLAPGALRLADKIDEAEPALMVVDTGQALFGGSAAPARRVRLPWGNHSVDFTTINANGLAIMAAAIDWAGRGNPVGPSSFCGVPLADVAGSYGPAGNGGIDSDVSFDQWFVDVPGTNLSTRQDITLTNDGYGVYEYLDNAFHPIDDRLFGNEGASHNCHFTYVIRASFTYDGCTDQFIEFEGGDGVWLFIDDALALDLGGYHPGTRQYLELDRLGLTDGGQHEVSLFYAQRDATASIFRLRTNIHLTTVPGSIAVSSMFD